MAGINLNDRIAQAGPSISRGTKFAMVIVSLIVGWIVYIKVSPSDNRQETGGQAMALVSRPSAEIKQPAPEKDPPTSKPQAQTPRPQAAPKPAAKKEKNPFAERQKEKRLAGMWAWPTPTKGESAEQRQGSTQQTLEIPPASSATGRQPAVRNSTSGGEGNVWNSRFDNRRNGQAGPLQYAGDYVIRRGWKIPCRLNEPINTDSPGQVSCTVVSDILDSTTGRFLLIPAGSTFVGAYDTDTIYGQRQVAVAWDELQFPNGMYRHIPAMPAADRTGVAGVPGKVDNHLFSTLMRSALLTVTGATAMVATHGAYGGGDLTASDALIAQGGREIRRSGESVGRRGMNRPPTVTTEAGEVILIQVTSQLRFDGPYSEGSDYVEAD